MRPLWCAFAAVLLAGCASAHDPSSTPAQRAGLDLLVLDDERSPVGGAEIRLPLLERLVVADQEGRAFLGDLPLGATVLVVTAAGYAENRDTVRLEPGNNRHEVIMTAAPGRLFNFFGESHAGTCMRGVLTGTTCQGDPARIPAPNPDGSLDDLPPRIENFTLDLIWDTSGVVLTFEIMVRWSENATAAPFSDGTPAKTLAGTSPLRFAVGRAELSDTMRNGHVHILARATQWENWAPEAGDVLWFTVGASVWYEDPPPM